MDAAGDVIDTTTIDGNLVSREDESYAVNIPEVDVARSEDEVNQRTQSNPYSSNELKKQCLKWGEMRWNHHTSSGGPETISLPFNCQKPPPSAF